MWSNRHLIWIFYRSILVLNLSFSFGIVVLLMLAGWSFVMVATLIKLMVYVAIIGYKYSMAQKEFYYYRNAGISINRLYFHTLVIDFSFYLIVVATYYFIK